MSTEPGYLNKKRINANESISPFTNDQLSEIIKKYDCHHPFDVIKTKVDFGFKILQAEKSKQENLPTKKDERALLKALATQAKRCSKIRKKSLAKEDEKLRGLLETLYNYGQEIFQSLEGAAHDIANEGRPYPTLENLSFIQKTICNPAEKLKATYHLDQLVTISNKAATDLANNEGYQGKVILKNIIHYIECVYFEITEKHPIDNFTYSGNDPATPCRGEFFDFFQDIHPSILTALKYKPTEFGYQTEQTLGRYIYNHFRAQEPHKEPQKIID